jgi:GT2 family glycosyltransferase
MYYEDLDLCLRASKAGFGLAAVTQAKMWHRVSLSTGGPESPMKQYHQVKSSIIFYTKHTRGLWLFVNLGIRIGHAGWITLKQLLRGRLRWETARCYFQGVAEAIRGLA